MDIQALVELYGLPGLIIGGLVLDRVRLIKRLYEQEDGRLEDVRAANRETQQIARETQRTLDALQRLIEARNGGGNG